MTEKLVYRSYYTHVLQEAGFAFKQREDREPKVFVRREKWAVQGPKELQDMVFTSRFCPAYAISIPLFLDMQAMQAFEFERANRSTRFSQQTANISRVAVLERRPCQFCGNDYEVTAFFIGPHCRSDECERKYQDTLKDNSKLKQDYSIEKPVSSGVIRGNKSTKPDETTLIDFSLDDPNTNTAEGWVYLIESEVGGLFRIGRSNDVYTRFSSHVAEIPNDILLIHTIRCNDYIRSEKYLHDFFWNKRHHGEWFALTPDDVEWLLALEDGALNHV